MSLSNGAYLFRQRPAAGTCLAALTGAFPVCFLEPALNQNNPYSIYNTQSAAEREGNKHDTAWNTPQYTLIFLLQPSTAPTFQSPAFLFFISVSVRPGAARSGGGHMSPPAFSGSGSRGSGGVGRCRRWSSPGSLHPCHGGHLAHAVQLRVPLVALGPRGPVSRPSLHLCHSSAR